MLTPTVAIPDTAITRSQGIRGLQQQAASVRSEQSSAGIDEQLNQLLTRQMTEALLPKADSKGAGSSSLALDRARTMLADALSNITAQTLSHRVAPLARELVPANRIDTP